MRNIAQLAVEQAMTRMRLQHVGQGVPVSIDTSDGVSFTLNTSSASLSATALAAAQNYIQNSGAEKEVAFKRNLAQTMLNAVPVLGWITQAVISTVGWAQGGGGVCADGQPHPELYGTWESNIGPYDATKGSPLTDSIIGSERVFGPASDFEQLAYVALRQDYDSGLTCATYGAPPKPMSDVFLTLLTAYNKLHANQEPVTHVRRWTTSQPGTWQGQPVGTLSLDPWSNDPITYVLSAEMNSRMAGQPIGNTQSDQGLVVGRVVSMSFEANTGPPSGSTSSNIPTGASLIPASYKQPPPPPPSQPKITIMPIRMGPLPMAARPVAVEAPIMAHAPVAPRPAPSAVGFVSLVGVGISLAVGMPWVAAMVLGTGATVGAIKAWVKQ